MTAESLSPKRRQILSSINRKEPCTSPSMDDVVDHEDQAPPPKEPSSEPTESKASRFRFKSKISRSHRSSRYCDKDYDRSRDERTSEHDRESSSSHRRHHRKHHHHRYKRRRSRSYSPTLPNPHEPPPLDPDAAFRESLFDAMADDEGAAYWESVYGQPIHTYSNAKKGPEGELEQMNDDEYAAYVRQKMWEKTHQGLLEERARREETRAAKEKMREQAYRNTRKMGDEAAKITREMEESLLRGEQRRQKKSWKATWDEYAMAWTIWDGTPDSMRWPVKSGRRDEVSSDDVRGFFISGLDPREIGETEFMAKLKEERVRWHPDKMQHKSGNKLDEPTIKIVTAIFQVIDKLWSDTRPKAK